MIKLIKSSFYQEPVTKYLLSQFVQSADIFSMGEQCKLFENKFSQKQERTYSVYVSNGSAANLVLLQSLLNLGHLKKGDRVGFSALTWATNVMPILQLGLIPVPIDCSLETLNVSPDLLLKEIKTLSALFLTNVLGFSDQISEIKDLCKVHNVLLLEDNCESLGSKVSGKLLGNFGFASTFSFFVGHHFSTIEGGMICTDDKELYESLVMVRAHGWDRNLSGESQKELRAKHGIEDFYAKYTFYDLAYNTRPTEIQGFLGCKQIEYWDEIVSLRENNFKLFAQEMQQNNDFYNLQVSHMQIVSNFAMPIICKTKELWRYYLDKFTKAEVEVRPIIAGDITSQPFFKKYSTGSYYCPNAKLIHEQGFYFPNNPELFNEDLKILINLVKK
jgi:CDP-6-deoxy-D-xylo-4-hexulose-3-dehydrase